MRLIKLGIISIIFFFLLITIISLLIPSHVKVSRALDMNTTPARIHEQIDNPENWKKWFPGTDTVELFVENGKARGVTLDAAKNRSLVIKSISPDVVKAAYEGVSNKKVETSWSLSPGPTPGTVTLQWYTEFDLKWYPWEKFASLMFDKQYGGRMDEGLNRLKALVEKNAE